MSNAKKTAPTAAQESIPDSKVEYIALGDMQISDRVQRNFMKYRADKLLSEFDINALGMISVSRRDGKNYVVDGQHRRHALIAWLGDGWEKVKVSCRVFTGFNEEGEARLFLKLNDRLKVSAVDEFRIGVHAKLPTPSGIKAVLDHFGLVVSNNHTGGLDDRRITAVGALTSVFNLVGAKGLYRVIKVIQDSYGTAALRAEMINGIGALVRRYGEALDDKRLVQKLGDVRGGMKGLVTRAQVIRERTNASSAIAIAAATVDVYNGPGSGRKALPNWWKVEEAA